jgi:hypothetical protein
MNRQEIIVKSFFHATGTVLYIGSVAWVMFNAAKIFGENEPDTFLIPLLVLTLFVISACVTGLLVLGRPLHLYLSGLKQEAFTFLFATIAWLIVFLAVVGGVLIAM